MTKDSNRICGNLPPIQSDLAAEKIPKDATILVSGFGSVGYPKAVPEALAESNRDLSLSIVSGGSVGEAIDVALVEADAIARRYPYQARTSIQEATNNNQIAFSDRHISSLGDEVQFGGLENPDVAIVEAVAVGQDWFIPSTSVGHTPAFVESADRLIIEVNTSQPRSLEAFHDIHRPDLPPNREPVPISSPGERISDSKIFFNPDSLESVVETQRRDEPYSFRDPTDDDLAIAAHLRAFLLAEVERSPIFEDSIRLQFGVGSLGNALMSALSEADFGARDIVYFGEVIQDGLLDLIDQGQLRSASATSLALSSDGQDRLFENASHYAENIVLRPADVSNSPSLINRFGVISVNSALEVDLYGHVNSTHLKGSQIVNGIGGSGDFTRNSPLSIIVLPSTAVDGDVSRIVPMVPHVDHTEHDIDVVVTEQGVADLRGASPIERAQILVNECAHSSYRDDLDAYLDKALKEGGHIPHDIESAFSWTK